MVVISVLKSVKHKEAERPSFDLDIKNLNQSK